MKKYRVFLSALMAALVLSLGGFDEAAGIDTMAL